MGKGDAATFRPLYSHISSPCLRRRNSNLNPLAEMFVLGEEVLRRGEVNSSACLENQVSNLTSGDLREISTPIAHEIPSHALSEVATIDNCEKILFLNEEASLDTLLFDKYASKESFKGEDISHQEVSHVLKQIRVENINRVIIGHLNVNFFAMKLDAIKTIIPGNVDIMVFGETKLNDSHPIAQI